MQKALDDLDDAGARAARAGDRARDPPRGRLHLRQRHPPPARARQLRLVQPHPRHAPRVRRSAALRVHAGGQPARVADLPEPAAQPLGAGRARRAVRGAGRAPGRGGRSRGSRSSAPCTRSTIPDAEQAKEQAKRIYSQGVAVTKDVITGAGWAGPPASRGSSARCSSSWTRCSTTRPRSSGSPPSATTTSTRSPTR